MTVWVLNLDADDELAGRGVSRAARRAMGRARRVVTSMLAPGDRVLDGPALGEPARAWCPTPSALARIAQAGALVPPAPSVEILRAVNERGFAHALGPSLATCCTTLLPVEEMLDEQDYLLKRGLACAGRGQRRLAPPLGPEDRSWITRSLVDGALYVEPRVEILLEVGLHGWVHAEQRAERGRATIQVVERARWQSARLAEPGELERSETEALSDAFERSAAALRSAGYFGPFGIDAFRYRHEGAVRFHPLSELNARYSMGWAIGMGGLR